MKTKLYLFTGLIALFSQNAVAQDIQAPTQDIIVTLLRRPVSIHKTGQAISVLNQANIEGQQSLRLGDLLAKTPSISVTQYGGPGSPSTAFIRGAESDHTLYIIDGVKLSDPSQVGGGASLGNIVSDNLSQIEILRGPLSTLWGSRALGGVVNLISAKPKHPNETRLSVQGGNGYNQASLATGGRSSDLTWWLSGSKDYDQGISSFVGGGERDKFDQTKFNALLDWKMNDDLGLKIQASSSHSRNEYDGFPAPLYQFADTLEFGKNQTHILSANLYGTSLNGRLKQSISLSRVRSDRQDFYDDKTPSFLSRGVIDSLDYLGNISLSEHTQALVIATIERQDMTTRSPAPWDPTPAPFIARSELSALGLQLSHQFTQGLNLTTALRYEDSQAYGGHTIGHIALSYAITSNLLWRASLGQGFKAPSLFQLFSDYGNLKLRPETSMAYDSALEFNEASNHTRFSIGIFSRQTRQQIDFANCVSNCATRPYGFYDNIAKTDAKGLELEYERDLSDKWRLMANYTKLLSRNLAKGVNHHHDLARRPRDLGNIGIIFSPNEALSLRADIRHVGKAYDNLNNTIVLKAYDLLELTANYRISPTTEIFGRVENATNTRYQSAYGYGQTGRRIWLGLRVKA